MNDIVIRQGTTKDAELIADVSRQTFYDAFAAQNTAANMEKFMCWQFTRQKLIREVGVAGNTFLLAYVNNEVAGYVRLCERNHRLLPEDVPAMEIARIFAVNDHIGRGVGSALMRYSVDLSYTRGKEVMWLGVWEKNQRAIDFYTRWGFEQFGEHEFLLGDDVQQDWLMCKRLG